MGPVRGDLERQLPWSPGDIWGRVQRSFAYRSNRASAAAWNSVGYQDLADDGVLTLSVPDRATAHLVERFSSAIEREFAAYGRPLTAVRVVDTDIALQPLLPTDRLARKWAVVCEQMRVMGFDTALVGIEAARLVALDDDSARIEAGDQAALTVLRRYCSDIRLALELCGWRVDQVALYAADAK